MAYDDEEQLETIRRWWQENGRFVLIAVGSALVLLIGWQQWNSWQARQAASASVEYAAVLSALEAGDYEGADNRLQALRDARSGSPHAALASFAMAASEMAQGEPEAAAETLGWIVSAQGQSPMVDIARLRQAEALAAAGDHEAARELVQPGVEGALAARYLELRGDLELALGNRQAAIEAYQQALEGMIGQRRALVEVKLFDLGGIPAS